MKKQILIIDDTKLTESEKEAISDSIAQLFFDFFSKNPNFDRDKKEVSKVSVRTRKQAASGQSL